MKVTHGRSGGWICALLPWRKRLRKRTVPDRDMAGATQPHALIGESPPLLQIQDFVEGALAVAFQVERDVFESQGFEDGSEALGHFHGQRALHFFAGDFDADYFAVEAHAELAEAEGLDLLFAGLDGLDVLDGDRRSVGNAGAE